MNAKDETESAYPYTSGGGRTFACKSEAASGVVGTKSDDYVMVTGTKAAMKSAINKNPVSVAIKADTSYFQTY